MCGTCAVQYPTTPIFIEPASTTVANVINASAPVVANAPVGEPAQGTMPRQVAGQDEEEQRQQEWAKRSASCDPMVGRATWSRMNTTIASKHVPDAAARSGSARDPPGQRYEDGDQHNRADHLQHHEFGDPQIQRLKGKNPIHRLNAGLDLDHRSRFVTKLRDGDMPRFVAGEHRRDVEIVRVLDVPHQGRRSQRVVLAVGVAMRGLRTMLGTVPRLGLDGML